MKTLSSSYANITNHISNLSTGTGTNIGDALRRAYYILDDGDSEAEQYVIMITDGEANAFSYSSINKKNNGEPKIGTFFRNYGNFSKDISLIRTKTYLTADNTPKMYFVNNNEGTDYKDYSYKYALEMAENFDGLDVHSFYIGYSNDTDNVDLNNIASAANASHMTSNSEADLSNKLSQIIGAGSGANSSVMLRNVRFEEILPANIVVNELRDGLSLSDNTLIKDFNIPFSLNAQGTFYAAEPIYFSVDVIPEINGTYVFGANDTSGIHFIDFDDTLTHVYFEPKTLTVAEADINLQPDNVLDVLEVQPGRLFELSNELLESEFPGWEINLTQMTLNQFDGDVEMVNGVYDVVYFGATESFTDYSITGITKGNPTSIIADIDITNRKANQVLEYVQSGQLLILDEDIFDYSDSKIKNNFKDIRTLDNVHEITSMGSAQMDNLFDWYKVTTHRPRLTVIAEPVRYDEVTFDDDHLLSYLYAAYNEDENGMTVHLYLDLDGDGVYEEDEEVKRENIIINATGLGINYQLDEFFNGLMPWKIELVDDTTNAKDYHIGYTAYKGTKTEVNVLQLTPGANRMNIDSTAFKKSLDTPDYKINITFMQVKDFDEAYAAWELSDDPYPADVNGYSTVINGNYDMILFGFGDSYGGKSPDESGSTNKDLDSAAAIDAIDDFISTGQSIMFTHDTAGPEDEVNNFEKNAKGQYYNDVVNYNDAPNMTENFKDDMGFSNTRTYAGKKMWRAWNTTNAYKLNDGLITMYPYNLADNATGMLPIARTHDQYWEIDLEGENVVPWFTLDAGNFKYYPAAYFYTFSNGNVTYSGTGHSTPSGAEEQEFFVNTMIKASRTANHAPFMDVEDLYNGMNVQPLETTIDFKLTIHDIDYYDIAFDTSIYLVYNEEEHLAKQIYGMDKDIRTDISIEKPESLDASVESFTIKIVVEDAQGATGTEEFISTHRHVPALKVIGGTKSGYLVGDTISVSYLVDTANVADKDVINGINLKTVVDTSKLSVSSATDWAKSGSTYSISPMFDDKATSANEEKTSFNIKYKAENKGSNVAVSLNGDYDIVYNDGNTNKYNVPYTKTNTFDILSGTINVEVRDHIGRQIIGADVSVKNSQGNLVASGVTDIFGKVTVLNLKTDIYTVEITGYPYGFIADADKAVDIGYGDGATRENIKTVSFVIQDTTPPTIEYKYITILTGGIIEELPIHLKLDGENSKVKSTYYKKLPDGVSTATAADFIGDNEGSNIIPLNYDPIDLKAELRDTPYMPDSTRPVGYEVFNYFVATENGKYAVYTINEAGNATVRIINISIIGIEWPDII